jgi:hypothetical protein
MWKTWAVVSIDQYAAKRRRNEKERALSAVMQSNQSMQVSQREVRRAACSAHIANEATPKPHGYKR